MYNVNYYKVPLIIEDISIANSVEVVILLLEQGF